MANGGSYNTKEEWQRIEAPLLEVDSIIEAFAAENGLAVSKNHKDWPERSIEWGQGVRCLIQLYLSDQKALTWNLWLCATQDRDIRVLWWKRRGRFWKKEMLIESKSMSEFAYELPGMLREGKMKLDHWHNNPKELEFVTVIPRIENLGN